MANLLFATSRCIRYSYPTVTRVRCASTDNTRPTVDFSDARKALKSKSTIDLIKSYLIYSLFKYDIFVDNSFKVLLIIIYNYNNNNKNKQDNNVIYIPFLVTIDSSEYIIISGFHLGGCIGGCLPPF